MEEAIKKFEKTKICVFGIQGSGKTYFVENFLINLFKKPIVYLMHEEDFAKHGHHTNIHVPLDKEGNVDTKMETLNKYCKDIKKMAKKGEVDAFVIDEADLFIRKDFRNLQNYSFLQDLIINHRHYGLAMVFITRRPQELSTVITEQSAHYFIFSIGGKNVKLHLNAIYDNLGEMAGNLDKDSHNFLHLEFGKKNPLTKYQKIVPINKIKNISK